MLLLHNLRYQTIIYIIWDVTSDITKKNYLKVAKIIMSGWSATSGLCQREAQPTRNYQFFIICAHLKIIYSTNFVQSQFWWIADCGFNDIRHIFIQSFVLVVHHVGYTICLWGWLVLNFTVLVLNTKNCFYCLYRSRTNYIRFNNLNITKTTEKKFSRFAIYVEAISYLLW